MEDRKLEVVLTSGRVESFSQFRDLPSFDVHTGTEGSPDFLLVKDGESVEAGYLLTDVKAFWIFNP